MTEPHPKFIEALTDTQIKRCATDSVAYFQSLLDRFGSEADNDPDAIPFLCMLRELQSLHQNTLVQYSYVLDGTKENQLHFAISFDEFFYKDVTGENNASGPVVTISIQKNACSQLITQYASSDVLRELHTTVSNMTPMMCTVDIVSGALVYLSRLLPVASNASEQCFQDQSIQQFKLVTELHTHEIKINLELIQAVINGVAARVALIKNNHK